jgi:hypothetical protein
MRPMRIVAREVADQLRERGIPITTMAVMGWAKKFPDPAICLRLDRRHLFDPRIPDLIASGVPVERLGDRLRELDQ